MSLHESIQQLKPKLFRTLISFYYMESCKIVEYKYFLCSNIYNKLYRMPRVFIISSHGSMPVVDDDSFAVPKTSDVRKPTVKKQSRSKKSVATSASAAADSPSAAPPHGLGLGLGLGLAPPMGAKIKKPGSFFAKVDTFTTAKCGQPFCADLRCDAPYVGLVHILSQYRLPSHVPKEMVRQIIKQVMLDIKRDPRHADSLTRAENKIRCHKTGQPITELFLFGPSHELPIVESVTMVDMETGQIHRDAHAMFGLVEKHASTSRPYAAAQFDDDDMAGLQYAKQRAEWDLYTLQGTDPFYVNMKKEQIKTIDATIAGELKESKFEYSPELKEKYGERVKLSVLLEIGLSNGLNPKTDFFVVYACRMSDEPVTFPLHSPRNSSDSEHSVGGGTRSKPTKQRCRTKTCKQRRH